MIEDRCGVSINSRYSHVFVASHRRPRNEEASLRSFDARPYPERGISLRRRSAEGSVQRSGQLSPRELEVLHLVALGNTVRQASTAMGLAASTVETYVGRLQRKLGVHGKAAAVRTAARQGYLI